VFKKDKRKKSSEILDWSGTLTLKTKRFLELATAIINAIDISEQYE
jgi:hypothetical protein